MSKRLVIYVDGGSHGNPGPSGIGVIICDEKGNVAKNISKFIGDTTNNVAEYTALIYGLQEALILRADEVIINTDSELLAKQLSKEYKTKDAGLKPLYEQVSHLLTGFKKYEIKHIDRSENKGADRLANKAVGEESLF
ncbi:MAG: ribonuclease HI family protein [Candidatus Omnitrophota bacterium]|nr:ribonuclease HI family protein [Candidatus Omnitrophota bacterium]